MKVLRRGTCISTRQKVFAGVFTILFIFSVRSWAKPIDCEQFTALFGLIFSNHRIEFSGEQIYSIYKNSTIATISALDPKGTLFTPEEVNSIVNGITAQSFAKCSEQTKINEIYASRSFAGNVDSIAGIYEMQMGKVLASLDPHSNFFGSAKWGEFKRRITGKAKGLGINFIIHDNHPMISKVIKGSPAESVLLSGDIIIEINGLSTRGLSHDNFTNILKASKDTIILVIKRVDQTLTVEIEKEEFSVPSVEWKYEDYDSGILYVRLEQFSKQSFEEMEEALIQASRENYIRGLMLDLRYNPGGYLSVATEIASLFLTSDLVATIVDREGEKDLKVESSPGYVEREIPMTILINNFSASASELLAQTMKDYQRAMIIGTNSFGKGTGQSVLSPESLSKYISDEVEVAITLTTFQFYSPFGNSPQKFGVTPHLSVKDERLDEKIKEQIAAAKAKGKDLILREGDYENALPVNVIDARVEAASIPTNDMTRIKDELTRENVYLQVELKEEVSGLRDLQYETAYRYLKTYTERCTTYHEDTCSFGGPYASIK